MRPIAQYQLKKVLDYICLKMFFLKHSNGGKYGPS